MKIHILHNWLKWTEPYLAETVSMKESGTITLYIQSRICKICEIKDVRIVHL